MKNIQDQIAKKARQSGRLRPKRNTNSTSMNGGESERTQGGYVVSGEGVVSPDVQFQSDVKTKVIETTPPQVHWCNI